MSSKFLTKAPEERPEKVRKIRYFREFPEFCPEFVAMTVESTMGFIAKARRKTRDYMSDELALDREKRREYWTRSVENMGTSGAMGNG